jgi:hypothetical protein
MNYKTLLSMTAALLVASAAQAQVAKSFATNQGPGGVSSSSLLGAVSDPDAGALEAKSYFINKKEKMTLIPGDLSFDTNGASGPVVNAGANYSLGFEGISQYDGASFGRNFVPPDTNGAVGLTQYMEVSNGSYAVFDKYTGVRTSLVSDVAFWAAAGQTGANGDSRILYNADAKRWIAISFGASVADIQIAVSNTDNALGTWQSTKFTGYAGGTADYPTLAMDKNSVYISTNNFANVAQVACGNTRFCGTTLNVIPLNSLFNGLAPTTTNMKQFNTAFTNDGLVDDDRGFAIQGVNSSTAGGTGTVIGASLYRFDEVMYSVNGLTPISAAGSSSVKRLSPLPVRPASRRQVLQPIDGL